MSMKPTEIFMQRMHADIGRDLTFQFRMKQQGNIRVASASLGPNRPDQRQESRRFPSDTEML